MSVSFDPRKSATAFDHTITLVSVLELSGKSWEVGAIVPGARIAVYFSPNSDAGFIDAVNRAIHDDANKPSVISISWGGPESSWTAQSQNAFNDVLQSAAAMGVTVCVASGDKAEAPSVTNTDKNAIANRCMISPKPPPNTT